MAAFSFFVRLFVLFTWIVVSSGHGQIRVQGWVVDALQKPIAYVNIGIVGSTVGTTSNPDGTFEIAIPDQYRNDSLIFSALGYQPKKFVAGSLYEWQTIVLDEKRVLLQTITVSTTRAKPLRWELGNDQFKGGVIQGDTATAGATTALLIDGRRAKSDFSFPAYVEKVRVRIFRNNLEEFTLRVRLLSVDSLTGQPGVDLLYQSMVQSSRMRSGWLELDFSSLRHVITRPFYLAVERIVTKTDRQRTAQAYRQFILDNPKKVDIDTVWVDGSKKVRQILKGAAIDLPATFIAIEPTKAGVEEWVGYTRETPFAPWKKVRGILTATVVLATQIPGSKN